MRVISLLAENLRVSQGLYSTEFSSYLAGYEMHQSRNLYFCLSHLTNQFFHIKDMGIP